MVSDILPTDFRRFVQTIHDVKSGKISSAAVALCLVIFVPYLHIGIIHLKLWVPDKQPVDKETCTCSCFDTVFKGAYESPGFTRYKHVYFNATENTFKIWTVTALFMVMFYESVKYLIELYQNKRMLFSWLFLYLSNIYPNYYSWWMLFGYYNDEFYSYLSHQIYFCITELIVTCLVLNLCNKDSEQRNWKIVVVFSVSLVHVLVSSVDQFVSNIIMGQGKTFQNSRDIGLMIPDLFHAILAGYWYIRLVTAEQQELGKVVSRNRQRDLMFACAIFVSLLFMSHLL